MPHDIFQNYRRANSLVRTSDTLFNVIIYWKDIGNANFALSLLYDWIQMKFEPTIWVFEVDHVFTCTN